MSSVRTETETVIKRILSYLRRRGYDPETDVVSLTLTTPARERDDPSTRRGAP